MPKLKLIAPAPKGKYCNKGKTSFPQLNLRILEALTPEDFDVSIWDERIEDVDFNDSPDIVGITVLTSVALRAYEIADIYRSRGIPVILGGVHPSLLAEEAMQHSDSVVIGEGEGVWKDVIRDFRTKSLKKKYIGKENQVFDTAFPKIKPVRKPSAFSVPHTIQTTRGCPFGCDFCSVTELWGNKYRFRPIDDVVNEIKAMNTKRVVIIDDNVVGVPKHAAKFFEKITPLNIKWAGQASITLARDKHMLPLLKKSGCEWLFIGIESLSPQNLSDVNKDFNRIETIEENIKKIKKAGINVMGSFIFGFDHDDRSVFDKVVNFCIRAKIDAANFFILTPLPGTKVYTKMEQEGRILSKNWNLYEGNHVVFRPKHMEPAELLEGYINAYKKMYSTGSIFRRVGGLSVRTLQMLSLNLLRMKNRETFSRWCRSDSG